MSDDDTALKRTLNEYRRIIVTHRFLFAAVWIVSAFMAIGILSLYSYVGCSAIMEQLKVSDNLGYCFLVVTLYGSHLILIGYVIITGSMWLINIFEREIDEFITWLKKFKLTRVDDNDR